MNKKILIIVIISMLLSTGAVVSAGITVTKTGSADHDDSSKIQVLSKTYTYSGLVKTKYLFGKAVSGAKVEATLNGVVKSSTKTNIRGGFTLTGLECGKQYMIIVSKQGYNNGILFLSSVMPGYVAVSWPPIVCTPK